ncbi:hypothetical protein [Pseudooceanicola sp. HF7]|uniref:hypothetical protein n=1 Tax=Pseudooceanicola sp. HF7 TaxID=2721560 RepID=UPI001431E3DB|nr:hypothetical protein [Pseudooceanicola sp. HF7]NIZ10980.1 hypothetical protein [Pseudooceanicola sp. HF7]
MARVSSDEDKAHMVLDVFKHFGTRSGEVIMPEHAMAIAMKRDWCREDLVDGLQIATLRGWIEDGPNQTIRLTEEGFFQVERLQRPRKLAALACGGSGVILFRYRG